MPVGASLLSLCSTSSQLLSINHSYHNPHPSKAIYPSYTPVQQVERVEVCRQVQITLVLVPTPLEIVVTLIPVRVWRVRGIQVLRRVVPKVLNRVVPIVVPLVSPALPLLLVPVVRLPPSLIIGWLTPTLIVRLLTPSPLIVGLLSPPPLVVGWLSPSSLVVVPLVGLVKGLLSLEVRALELQ